MPADFHNKLKRCLTESDSDARALHPPITTILRPQVERVLRRPFAVPGPASDRQVGEAQSKFRRDGRRCWCRQWPLNGGSRRNNRNNKSLGDTNHGRTPVHHDIVRFRVRFRHVVVVSSTHQIMFARASCLPPSGIFPPPSLAADSVCRPREGMDCDET